MIHHYTSINNLALILKNKKIRFNRLDKVDDISELNGIAQFFSTCIFVSCWTEDQEENIPLWKMYTPNMQGIRISLPKEMFQRKIVKAFQEANYGIPKDNTGPLSKEELFTDEYIVMNVFDNPTSFFKRVIYQNDYPGIYESLIKIDHQGIKIERMFELGAYKHEMWYFQKESRFTLYISPLLPLNHSLIRGSKFQQMQLASYPLNNGFENSINYIDIDLDEIILSNIIITIGPLCSIADEIVVSSLLKEFTSNGAIKRSSLFGIIRKQ